MKESSFLFAPFLKCQYGLPWVYLQSSNFSLQIHRAFGISSPARKTSALPNSGSVTARTTAVTDWTKARKFAVKFWSTYLHLGHTMKDFLWEEGYKSTRKRREEKLACGFIIVANLWPCCAPNKWALKKKTQVSQRSNTSRLLNKFSRQCLHFFNYFANCF